MRGEKNTFLEEESEIAELIWGWLHDRIGFGKQLEVALENSTKKWSLRVAGHMPDEAWRLPSEVPNDRSTLVRPGAMRTDRALTGRVRRH